MQLVQDGQPIQAEAVATFYLIVRAHMKISFIIKVKILMLIKWSQVPSNHVGY